MAYSALTKVSLELGWSRLSEHFDVAKSFTACSSTHTDTQACGTRIHVDSSLDRTCGQKSLVLVTPALRHTALWDYAYMGDHRVRDCRLLGESMVTTAVTRPWQFLQESWPEVIESASLQWLTEGCAMQCAQVGGWDSESAQRCSFWSSGRWTSKMYSLGVFKRLVQEHIDVIQDSPIRVTRCMNNEILPPRVGGCAVALVISDPSHPRGRAHELARARPGCCSMRPSYDAILMQDTHVQCVCEAPHTRELWRSSMLEFTHGLDTYCTSACNAEL
jgi:hypothetical protein